MKLRAAVAVALALALGACSFQNQYEREAEAITRAVMNNDLRPVKDDIEPGITITRTQVAAWADELGVQGKLLSLKEIRRATRAGIVSTRSSKSASTSSKCASTTKEK